jgi:phosphoribosylformimino-5-aminoimidazole carboxamide ribotide isomerase
MVSAMAFEILPAIDLRGGRVVRLRQGDFERETVYGDDPAIVAARFADEGARWIHVVDLDGARTGVPAHGPMIASIATAVGDRLGLEVAGGLRTEADVAGALEGGAARVVIGTAALRDPGFAARLVASHGAARVGVAVDVRDGTALGDGWTPGDTGLDATEAIRRLADAGVEIFEVTAIERDGLLEGPDLDLYERLVGLGRGRVIASGGITSLGDLRDLRGIGCAGAIAGRALYEGKLDLREAIRMTSGAREA